MNANERRWGMARRRIELPYGIEGWVPVSRFQFPISRLIRIVGEGAFWIGVILAGAGLAWIVGVLHGAGVTP